MAHQYLDQLTPQLRSSIATNTAIKLAGGVSDKDAKALASDMRTTADAIAEQRKGHFMCFVKNVVTSAVSIEIPFGRLEALPKQPTRLAPPSTPELVTGVELFATFSPSEETDEATAKKPKTSTSQSASPAPDVVGEIIPTRDW